MRPNPNYSSEARWMFINEDLNQRSPFWYFIIFQGIGIWQKRTPLVSWGQTQIIHWKLRGCSSFINEDLNQPSPFWYFIIFQKCNKIQVQSLAKAIFLVETENSLEKQRAKGWPVNQESCQKSVEAPLPTGAFIQGPEEVQREKLPGRLFRGSVPNLALLVNHRRASFSFW